MIPKETIDKIFEAAHIEEVVGDFVPLKKRGVNLIGLCPFHNEKTPSFTVSPAKGIYKCFGCGEAGNSVNFVMKHENFTYPEALKYLAQKYGIEVEEEEQTPEEIKKQEVREQMMHVTAFAAQYFHDVLLHTDEGKSVGVSYFNERGFNDFIIEKFQLGYAADRWNDFLDAAKKAGYSEEILVQTGLVVKTDEGKLYDRFRGRVIFPVHSLTGRPIAFGGRILDASKSKAKYVNSPESEIYHKSDVLYGIHLAKNAIIKARNCFLVEGYTDVISMHKAGIENVVASSGTSLTTGQIKMIKRFSPAVTILYDGDPAGIKASFRGIDMIVEEGLNVRVVLFPDGEDPDSFARKHSVEEINDFLEKESKDFILFKIDLMSDDAGQDPVKRAALVKDIVSSISLIPENIDRQLYIKEAAVRVDLDERLLVDEVNKYRRKKYFKDKNRFEPPPPETEPSARKAPVQLTPVDDKELIDREIISILLNYGSLDFIPKDSGYKVDVDWDDEEPYKVMAYVVGELLEEDLIPDSTSAFKKIFDEYKEAYNEGTIPSEKYFIQSDDDEVRNTAIDLLTTPNELSKNWWEIHRIQTPDLNDPQIVARGVISTLHALKSRIFREMINKNLELLKNKELSREEQNKIIKKIQYYQKKQKMLEQDKGRVILPQ